MSCWTTGEAAAGAMVQWIRGPLIPRSNSETGAGAERTVTTHLARRPWLLRGTRARSADPAGESERP